MKVSDRRTVVITDRGIEIKDAHWKLLVSRRGGGDSEVYVGTTTPTSHVAMILNKDQVKSLATRLQEIVGEQGVSDGK